MSPDFSKYTGQYVAMIDEQIVAWGKTSLEAYRKAKVLASNKLISLMYVPTKKETITFL